MRKKSILHRHALPLLTLLAVLSCSKDDSGGTPQQPENNAPEIQAQRFNASETIDDASIIGKVAATDSDGDALTFSIKTNSSNLFEITSGGDISLASGESLDYETATSHSLSIDVTDGEATSNATVTIDVVDVDENAAPVFIDQSFSIEENSPLGAEIGTVVATDSDGDTITFAWANPDEDDPTLFFPPGSSTGFTLDSATGRINTINLPAGLLNFEMRASYPLPIIASDGELTVQAEVTVNVLDVNEPPFLQAQRFEVPEDIDDSVLIGQIVASDPEGDQLTFTIDLDFDMKFDLSSSGEIRLRSNEALDFETKTFHSLRVNISDGIETVTLTMTIRVTDVDDNVSGVTVSTLAGSTQGTTNGTGSAAQFNSPRGVIVANNSGDLFVVDNGGKAIRKVTAAGVVTIVTSSGAFGSIRDIVIDSRGNLFVSDAGKHVIWKLELDLSFPPNVSYVRSVFAGSENNSGFINDTGSDARFNGPRGMAIDANDNIYVADFNNSNVRRITPTGTVTSMLNLNNGLINPEDVALTPGGSVYVTDASRRTVNLVRTNRTLTGTASFNFSPAGLVIQGTDIFVVNNTGNTIEKVATADNNAISLVAGIAGQAGDEDGSVNQARFRNPVAIDIDQAGNLYITDTNNHRIRKIEFN